jgi:hypothetical protein
MYYTYCEGMLRAEGKRGKLDLGNLDDRTRKSGKTTNRATIETRPEKNLRNEATARGFG